MSEQPVCGKCGQPVDVGADFCRCGYSLSDLSVAARAIPGPQAEAWLLPWGRGVGDKGTGRFSLFPGCTVGRGTDVDLSPVPDSQYISRSHARFGLQGDQWWIEALPAENETRVNGGVPLQPGVRRVLASGDTVTLGGVAFTFRPAPTR
jgi:hypothetical protein